MSKITFRADDDLVEGIEAFDASKSEVMRAALRAYLEDAPPRRDPDASVRTAPSIDDLVRERVDERVEERLASRTSDVDVSISLEGLEGVVRAGSGAGKLDADSRKTEPDDVGSDGAAPGDCTQCGESLDADHVYCPNCGEKTSRRVFCECGDEVRSDWSFCPGCGRRTPAADVLDPGSRRG